MASTRLLKDLPTRSVAVPDFLAKGGGCGALIAAEDWSASPLGPVDGWSSCLKTTLAVLLASPTPMTLLWGPDGMMLYNDAYAAIAGPRHPDALGRGFRDAWPEITEFNESVQKVCLSGGTLSYKDAELTLQRHGRPEKAYFNVDYSPVWAEDGQPAGVLAVVFETTAAVLAQRELLAAQERDRAAIDQMQIALDAGAIIGAWNWDVVDDRFTADERFARSFGLDPTACRSGLPTGTMTAAVHADDLPALQQATVSALAKGGAYRHECRVLLADGTTRWIEANGRVDLAPDGTPLRFPGVFLDIEERHAAAAERDQAQRLLETFVEAVPGVVYAKDRQGRILLANDGFAKEVGKPLAMCLGRTEGELLSDAAEAHAIWEADRRIMESGAAEQIEEHVSFADGTPAVWLSTKAPLRDASGTVVGVVGSSLDITERKAVEAALVESEARFRNMADHAPIMLWVTDASGTCTYVSRLWYEFTGQTAQEALDDNWAELAHPEDKKEAQRVFDEASARQAPFRIEYRMRRANGAWRWVIDAASPRLGPAGEFLGYIGSVMDITERKDMEAALRESEDHYRHTVELSPHIPWTADPQGRTLEILSRWQALTGLSREQGLGTGWLEAVHPEDVDATLRAWDEPLRTGEPYDLEHRLRLANGEYRWFWVRASARRDQDGNIVRWYGTTEDIHDRKMAENQLRESEAFANSVLENSKDCIEVIDLKRRLLFMNSSCRKLMEIYGFSVSPGQDWMELWPNELRAKASEAFAMARNGSTTHLTNTGLTLEGTMGFWDVTLSPIMGPTGLPERVLSVSRDITSMKVAQDELERSREAAEVAARHDSLTGLLNRPAFHSQLEQQLRQSTVESQTAVLFLDLDEFKSINDSLGHPAGDEMLRQAAGRLRTCLRGSDQIARFGGDEFAILQTSVAWPEQIESLAKRVIDVLNEPYALDGQEAVVGVSIGIAVADMPGVEADDLLKQADIALYDAKHAGKGVHRFFVPGMDEAAEERQRLRSELRDAITRGEFQLVYQPVVEFETARVTSFEALLRWQHPRRGLLSPGEFISVAEASGDIVEIGAWVLREACARAATWPDEIGLSVNLSPRQFRDLHLQETVSQALSESRLPAARLRLEITESVLLQDNRNVREALERLRTLGVLISLDDFGTGYSSLGYLLRFSVDNIKIDRTFVAELSENPRASAVLRALINLGTGLGVSLIAEGIETVTQLEELKAMGCRHGQGYLFSRPLAEDALKGFLSGGWERSMPAGLGAATARGA